MRKTKALVALCFMLLVTPIVMGVPTVTMTVTPNPGGLKNTLLGSGTYMMGKNETLTKIMYIATLKGTQQTTQLDATITGANWSSTLTVAAATYNPSSNTIYWVDALNNPQTTVNPPQVGDKVVN